MGASTAKSLSHDIEDSGGMCKAIGWVDLVLGILSGAVCIIIFLLAGALRGVSNDLANAVTALAYDFLVVALIHIVTGPVLVSGVHSGNRACLSVWIVKAWAFTVLQFPLGTIYYGLLLPNVTRLKRQITRATYQMPEYEMQCAQVPLSRRNPPMNGHRYAQC